jgi:hypothetical protein
MWLKSLQNAVAASQYWWMQMGLIVDLEVLEIIMT